MTTDYARPNDPARVGVYQPPRIKTGDETDAEWENGGKVRWLERLRRRDAKAEEAEEEAEEEAIDESDDAQLFGLYDDDLIQPSGPRTLPQRWYEWAQDERRTPEQRAIRTEKLEIEAKARGWDG